MLEVIVLLPEDARQAEAAGADRLELVTAMPEGGLTPSYSVIEAVVHAVTIPVRVMIRPHSRSFTYTEEEKELMKRDLSHAIELGAEGIVIGALTREGDIDSAFMQEVIAIADGAAITFHRAIDAARDPLTAYQQLAALGEIQTVLTSGGGQTVADGLDTLKAMSACDGPEILLGSGLTIDNIAQVHSVLQGQHYHIGSAARVDGSFANGIDANAIHRFKETIRS
ncbi:copper homeostasis protein CutC [Aureibacillus halotolerans]|uniref:PF03932 family protein CutC n=1 Tax=Aureibacillus halotolerans TaxID=1508390 RepID=A0A4R6U8E3_9BACI|nr:copper homeostasis protein CutC [Aureibacillus halotolerans]TDQ41049.1 copper homeostasis protein [Aureibacillus halotolerans]